MESKRLPGLKRIEKVKVKVSKNGKWLTHILPELGVLITFPMNYYRSVIKSHPELIEDLPTDTDPSKE